MATTKPKKELYSLSLILGDKTYKSTGETVLDALQALEHPPKIMLKGVIIVKKGKLKKEQLMYPVRLKRLFYNKNFLAIQAKYLEIGMKISK